MTRMKMAFAVVFAGLVLVEAGSDAASRVGHWGADWWAGLLRAVGVLLLPLLSLRLSLRCRLRGTASRRRGIGTGGCPVASQSSTGSSNTWHAADTASRPGAGFRGASRIPSARVPPVDINYYLQQLRNPDERVRADSVLQLGRLKVISSVDPLAATLAGDRSPLVREAAARALALIGSPKALACSATCCAGRSRPRCSPQRSVCGRGCSIPTLTVHAAVFTFRARSSFPGSPWE